MTHHSSLLIYLPFIPTDSSQLLTDIPPPPPNLTPTPSTPADSPQFLTDIPILNPSWLTTAPYWHTHPFWHTYSSSQPTHHSSLLTFPPPHPIPTDSPELLTDIPPPPPPPPPSTPADSSQLLTDIPTLHTRWLTTAPCWHTSLPFYPSRLTTTPYWHTYSSSQLTHHSSLLSYPLFIPADSPQLLTDIPPPPLPHPNWLTASSLLTSPPPPPPPPPFTPADSLQLFTNIPPPPPFIPDDSPQLLTDIPPFVPTDSPQLLTDIPPPPPPPPPTPPPSSQLTHHSSLPTSPPHPSRLTTTPYWHTHPSSQLTHHSFLLTSPPLLPQPTHHNSLLTCPPFIPANSPQLLTDTLTLHPSWLTTAPYWHTHPLSQLTHQPGSEKVSTPSCGGSNLCEGYIRDGHVVWYAIVHSGISSQLQKGVCRCKRKM